jgi:hypothetical protein
LTSALHLEPAPVSVRIRLSALWTSMLFVFVYVDHFSLYRADVRADIEAGEIAGFRIGEAFLLGATAYVIVPALMVVATLVLAPRASRTTNLVLSVAYGLTIVAGAIGEWGYYVLGSAVELGLLAAVFHGAWTWPRQARSGAALDAGSPVTIATGSST